MTSNGVGDETMTVAEADTEGGDVSRIYEVGYTIVPRVKEDELEKAVSAIRTQIEKAGGNFIAEGAPSSTRLAYAITALEDGKKTEYDRAYFGWIKFEVQTGATQDLEKALKQNADILRSIVFQTVREDTRAKMKAPTLREVRRTDTIKSAPRRITTDEEKAPISEEDLEKALKDITAE